MANFTKTCKTALKIKKHLFAKIMLELSSMLDDDHMLLGNNSLRMADCKVYKPSNFIIFIFDMQEKVNH